MREGEVTYMYIDNKIEENVNKNKCEQNKTQGDLSVKRKYKQRKKEKKRKERQEREIERNIDSKGGKRKVIMIKEFIEGKKKRNKETKNKRKREKKKKMK